MTELRVELIESCSSRADVYVAGCDILQPHQVEEAGG